MLRLTVVGSSLSILKFSEVVGKNFEGKMIKLKLFLLIVWSCAIQIEASGTKQTNFQTFYTDTTPGTLNDTSIKIEPVKGIDFSLGFTICFRAKFNVWAVSTPFKNSMVQISFGKLLDAVAYFSIDNVWYLFMWPYGVEQSPYVWYDFCLSYKASTSYILFTVNGVIAYDQIDPLIGNQTFAINDSIYFGQGLSSFVFSGWFSDINVWSRPLSFAELGNFSVCYDIYPGPDVVDWSSNTLNVTVGVKIGKVTSKRDELCLSNEQSHLVSLYIISTLKTYTEAQTDCRSLGGSMPLPLDANQMNQLLQAIKHEPTHENCGEGYWMPVIQSKKDQNKWLIDDGLESEATFLPWLVGQPNGGRIQNCTKTATDQKLDFLDAECDYPICSLCNLSTKSFLKLRGMCKYDNLVDEQYTLRVDLLKSEVYEFQGFTGLTKIWFNKTSTKWVILMIQQNSKIIATSVKQIQFPTGITQWTIDESICKLDSPSKLTSLKLTKCFGKFTCGDGSCISMLFRCNARMDCSDWSDEQGCDLVSFDTTNYQMFSPPNTLASRYTNIGMNITVESIDNFNDNTMSYKMKFSMFLMWFDNRLTFQNLKLVGNGSNMISDDELRQIWKPHIIFSNSVKASSVLYDEYAFVHARRDGKPIPSSLVSVHENEIFEGSQNPILYHRPYNLELDCRFELKSYPFDFQMCTLNIALSEGILLETALKLEVLNYTGEKVLNQFYVVDFCTAVSTSQSLVIIEIRLQRLYSFHLTNTFLPTASLLALSEITLFFNKDNADLAMGFSLTTLLVVYTMYQSISTSSPKTEYLKIIDTWIIFCLIMPLAIFMIEVFWKFSDSNSSIVERKGSKRGCCPFGSSLCSRKKLPLLVITCTIVFSLGYVFTIFYSIFRIEAPCGVM